MNNDEIEIRKLVADWLTANKAGDIDAVLAMMTDDVVFLTAGNPPMTKDAFAKIARAQASSGMEIDGVSDIKEVEIAGDWAFLWSHLSVRIKAAGQAQAVEHTGHTLTVFRKQAGRWLLARDANLLVASQPQQN